MQDSPSVRGYALQRAPAKRGKVQTSQLTPEEFEDMHTWPVSDVANMQAWVKSLKPFGVFFSQPLDLDFMMLRTFPHAYHGTAEDRGPKIPKEDTAYNTALKQAVRAVLKGAGSDGDTFDTEELRAFFWYRYLFLGRSKPSTHIMALAAIDDAELLKDAPRVLLRLIDVMKSALDTAEAEDEGE